MSFAVYIHCYDCGRPEQLLVGPPGQPGSVFIYRDHGHAYVRNNTYDSALRVPIGWLSIKNVDDVEDEGDRGDAYASPLMSEGMVCPRCARERRLRFQERQAAKIMSGE